MVKVIHYIWLGHCPKSKLIQKCIASWRRYMPDWKIIEWNESNLDININQYASDAYHNGKYAFASDFFRFDIIEKYGGLYLDTDVEILRPFEDILEMHDAVLGFEYNGETIAPGLILYAKEPSHPFIQTMRNSYEGRNFEMPENSMPMTICHYTTSQLIEYGAQMNDQFQVINGVALYPATYFCPTNREWSVQKFSNETRCIHHYGASWLSGNKNTKILLKKLFFRLIGNKGIFLLKSLRRKIYGY